MATSSTKKAPTPVFIPKTFPCQGCFRAMQLHHSFFVDKDVPLHPLLDNPRVFITSNDPDEPSLKGPARTTPPTPELVKHQIILTPEEAFEKFEEAKQLFLAEMAKTHDSANDGPKQHPLCADCASKQIDKLNRNYQEIRQINEGYRGYLNTKPEKTTVVEDIDGDIAILLNEKKQLELKLQKVALERSDIRQQREEIEAYQYQLELIEKEYFKELIECEAQLAVVEEDNQHIQRKIQLQEAQFNAIKNTTVLRETFHIEQVGPFGVINNCRLGNLPYARVEWNEINCALGSAALLLHSVAVKIGFKFREHAPIPQGSSSRIKNMADNSMCDMFGSSDFSVSKIFWFGGFDSGQTAFLKSLKELTDYLAEKDSSFILPYPIEKDNVGGMSIKTRFNSDENWTKACSYMLANLKYLLSRV